MAAGGMSASGVRQAGGRPRDRRNDRVGIADCVPNSGAAPVPIGPRTRDHRCGDIERRTRHGLAAWGLIGLSRPTRLQPARRADVAWHVTLRIPPSQRRPPRPLHPARASVPRFTDSPTTSIQNSLEHCRLAACCYRLGCPCAAWWAFFDRESPNEKRNADQCPATRRVPDRHR
jgi:hypothetical protein